MCKNNNYVSEYSFEDIDDFIFSLLHGRDIQFIWNDIEYGVFHDYDSGEKAFFICEAHKDDVGTYLSTLDEVLNFKIQNQPLKDIITKVDVCNRNL